MDVKKIVAAIRPSEEEEKVTKNIADDVARRLKNASRLDVVVAGSVAKGTALAGEGDIDVFILFGKKMAKDEMKKRLEKIFKKAFPSAAYQMNYAEHPYIKFHYNGKKIDVVPAYKISVGEHVLSAVDRSVLHTKYVIKNLKKAQRDEVRLLKKFLKSAGLYGAEIRVEGFSGYLCELLIIRYGSFMRLISNAARWKLPIVIDLKKYYKKSEYQALAEKFNKKLVVIDPTDRNRNVAAPLSEENLKRFISLARSFLKTRSEKYFEPEKSFEEKVRLMKKRGSVAIIAFPKADVVDDVLWGQIKKFIRALEFHLADFEPQKIIADSNDEVRIAVAVRKKTTGGMVEIEGPPLSLKENVLAFKNAHRGSRFVKRNGRIIARSKTPVKNFKDAIKEFVEKNAGRFSHLPLSAARVE